MLRRPFCAMAAGMCLGILAAAYDMPFLLLPVAGILLAGVWKKRGQSRAYLLLALLMMSVGWQRFREEKAFRETYAACLEDGERLTVQGTLSSKEYKNDQFIYYLTSPVLGILSENQKDMKLIPCNQIMARSDSDDYAIGQTLILNGTVELWQQAANEGNFDAQSFYSARGIGFKLKNIEVTAAYGSANRLAEQLYRLRLALCHVYQQAMNESDCGIMTAMALGDKTLLAEEIKELYQNAGIIHILSISGLHIAVIGMSLYRLLRKCGVRFACAGMLSGSVILCYGCMVGMGVSVQRATGMFLLSVAAQALGRTYDSLNALGVLAVVLLWNNPYLLFYAGFLFSYAAVIGVVWVGKHQGEEHGLSEKIRSGCSIQMMTLPITAWYYYEIPVYAALLNLFALPFLELLLICGIFGGFAGLFSIRAAKVLLLPCHLILWGYQKLCLLFGKLPCSVVITGRPNAVRMLLYYGILTVWTTVRLRRKKKEMEKIQNGQKNRTGNPPDAPCRRGFLKKLYAPVGGLLLLGFLLFPKKEGFELDVLDVGQGDGSFLRTGGGVTLFIDGGSTDIDSVGKYRILPFLKYNGVRKIDYWFLSHTDFDHISGLQELIETGYPIGCLVCSAVMEQDETYLALTEAAREQGTALLFLNRGDILHLGDAAVTALFPEVSTGDKNADSLVLRYDEGDFSALFTGDIGTEEEKKLLALQTSDFAATSVDEMISVDVYKAAHHGSDYSNSEEWLKQLHPAVSVVSCGENNSYGHPGENTIEHMEQAGSAVFCTMHTGQIKITMAGDEMEVRTYLQPLAVYRFSVLE